MELKPLIEAILFVAQKPMTVKEIKSQMTKAEDPELADLVKSFKKMKEEEIQNVVIELQKEFAESQRSFRIQEIAGSYQCVTLPVFGPWMRHLVDQQKTGRLSQPSLETLAIIAYRQPITRADIEAVRGVAVDGVMQTLLDRGLVTMTGRAEIPGRPMLYGTTRAFLEYFGLKDLNDLPNSAELKKTQLPTAAVAEQAVNSTEPVATEATPTDAPATQENSEEHAPSTPSPEESN